MKQTTLSDFGIEWLEVGHVFKNVTVHTNGGEQRARDLEMLFGCYVGSKVRGSYKHGKTPIAGNPYMHGGVQ